MMYQQQQEQPTDYEANVVQRKRNFIARAVAAVTGSITGIVTGQHLLKRSKRDYGQSRLFNRDWTGDRVEDSMRKLVIGETDTISGAITDPEKAKAWARQVLDNKAELQGTLIGDPSANAALRHLFRAHLTDEAKYLSDAQLMSVLDSNKAAGKNEVHTFFKDGFVKDAVTAFKSRLHSLAHERDERIGRLEKKFFKSTTLDCRGKIDELYKDLDGMHKAHMTENRAAVAAHQAAMDNGHATGFEAVKERLKEIDKHYTAARHAKLEGFDPEGLMLDSKAGGIHKFMEEEQKVKANFLFYANRAKQKLVDIPIYDELGKTGNDMPGRMGLSLRQAHNKGEIIAFSTIAAVGVGYMALKGTKAYLHRNDRGEGRDRTFQAGVTAGREAARHEQSQVI